MENNKNKSKLTKQIDLDFEELTILKKEMLMSRKMIRASLIKRYLGSKKHKRMSPAFYLSAFGDGKTKLRYIPKHKLPSVKIQDAKWREYQQSLKRWPQLTESIWRNLKQLGVVQNQLERQ